MSSSRRHLVEDWHDGEFEKRSRRKQCEVEKILKKANPVHEKQLPKREKKERERERERKNAKKTRTEEYNGGEENGKYGESRFNRNE